MPAAPVIILPNSFTPPTPSAPGGVRSSFDPGTPNSPTVIGKSFVSGSGYLASGTIPESAQGPMIRCGDIEGYPAWSNDGSTPAIATDGYAVVAGATWASCLYFWEDSGVSHFAAIIDGGLMDYSYEGGEYLNPEDVPVWIAGDGATGEPAIEKLGNPTPDPVVIRQGFDPGSPGMPASAFSYSPSSPSAPSAIRPGFSPGNPSAPVVIHNSYSPPHPPRPQFILPPFTPNEAMEWGDMDDVLWSNGTNLDFSN